MRTTSWLAFAGGVLVVTVGSAPGATAASGSMAGSVSVVFESVSPSGARLQVSDLRPHSIVTVSLDGDRLVTLRSDQRGSLDTGIPWPQQSSGQASGAGEVTVAGTGADGGKVAVVTPVTIHTADHSSSTSSTSSSAANVASRQAAGSNVALPPGGASSNTPGTTSSVSPSTLAQGATLSFQIGGYPAGETAYVKVDDGGYTGAGVIRGADIVASAKIGSDGKGNGTFTIPNDLSAGSHTLRILATKNTEAGALGYTNKSPAFTVTAAGGSSATPSSSAGTATGSTSTGTTGSTGSAGSTGSTGSAGSVGANAAQAAGNSSTKNQLARTGASIGLAVVVAAGLIAGGVLLKRRSRA